MNCKQGDLAIIVKSVAGNEGKIVRCIRYVGIVEYNDGGNDPSWEVDIMLKKLDGLSNKIIADWQLLPIRDSDKEDEMLRLIGKPETNEIKV